MYVLYLQLQEEMLSAYQQIRGLCDTIRHQHKRNRNHSEESLSSHVEDLQIGLLNESVLELKGLCLSILENGKNCCYSQPETEKLEQKSQMMTLALKQKEAELKKKDEEIVALQSQVRILASIHNLIS